MREIVIIIKIPSPEYSKLFFIYFHRIPLGKIRKAAQTTSKEVKT